MTLYNIFSVQRNQRIGPSDCCALHHTHVHRRILWLYPGQHNSRYDRILADIHKLSHKPKRNYQVTWSFLFLGTDKERGIKSWRDKVQEGSKNICDQSCYDIPFCNGILKRFRCFQYMPFLPSYKTNQQRTSQ